MSIPDLGPLEGVHSYQVEQLGAARIVAIESKSQAFQRCLVVKNLLSLDRTTFLLGDCASYLETTDERVDMIFASGILYHMLDPVGLIQLLAARTDRLFVWTQYDDSRFRYSNGKPFLIARDSMIAMASSRRCTNSSSGNAWGNLLG